MNETFERIDRLATAHGWMRAPDFDTSTFDAWEMPNGMMFPSLKGAIPILVTIVRHEGSAK